MQRWLTQAKWCKQFGTRAKSMLCNIIHAIKRDKLCRGTVHHVILNSGDPDDSFVCFTYTSDKDSHRSFFNETYCEHYTLSVHLQSSENQRLNTKCNIWQPFCFFMEAHNYPEGVLQTLRQEAKENYVKWCFPQWKYLFKDFF